MKLNFCIAALALCTPSLAQQPTGNPNEWVRHAVENELKAEQQDTSHWMFQLRTQKPGGKLELDEVAETAQGDVKWPLVINGKKLSPSESDKRMKQQLHDGDALQKSLKEKTEDAEKSQQLLKMLPDAFRFKYGPRRGDIIQLDFSPNPQFKPPTREAQVFHAMKGSLWFNSKQLRLQAISGRMIHEVKFGEGVLGHLDPGGRFEVKQAEVAPGFWEMTVLDVHMEGKALFFKTIDVQQDLSRGGFRKLPSDLAPEAAGKMLEQQASAK